MNKGIYNESSLVATAKAAGMTNLQFEESSKGNVCLNISGTMYWLAEKDKEAYNEGTLNIANCFVACADYEDEDGDERTTHIIYTKTLKKGRCFQLS